MRIQFFSVGTLFASILLSYHLFLDKKVVIKKERNKERKFNISLMFDVAFKIHFYLIGNICVKLLEESVSSDINVKSKDIGINSGVNLIVSEEDKGENFSVMTGKLNPESEGEGKSRTITAEAKLGSVKFEKIDWFSSLKFK